MGDMFVNCQLSRLIFMCYLGSTKLVPGPELSNDLSRVKPRSSFSYLKHCLVYMGHSFKKYVVQVF